MQKLVKILREWKYVFIFAPIILLLALILRIFHITILPVFADEAIYIRWSQIMGNEPTLRFLPLSDGKEPLFMWILMFIVSRIKNPLFAGRMVSALSGIGTMVGIFLLSYELFKSKKAALVAAFLWAVSPFSIFFDRMALVDSLLTVFSVWSLYLGSMAFKTKRYDFALLTGFAIGFGMLTKSPAIFFFLLMPSLWLFSSFPQRRQDLPLHLIKLGFLTLIMWVIGYGMYNILRLGPNFNLILSRNQDYVFPLSHLWMNPRDPLFPHFDRAIEWVRILGPLEIWILVTLSLLFISRKFTKQILVLSLWSFGIIAVESEFAKVFTARYILFALPALYVLASSIFETSEKIIVKIAFLVLGVFFIHSLYSDYWLLFKPSQAYLPRSERSGYLEEWTAGTGIYEVSQYLKTQHNLNPNQKIVVGTEGYFGTLPDGLQMYMDGTLNTLVLGVGLNLKEVPQSLLDSKKAGNKTYLVINNSRFKYKGNSADLGLKLVAQYPKVERELYTHDYVVNGPQEILYFFEVN